MSTQIYTKIKQLVYVREDSYLLRGKDLSELPVINDAYLIVEDGIIAGYGPMSSIQHSTFSIQPSIDLSGQIVLPAWCDSHTHLVFAGSRENEFVDKIKGLSYADIAAKGGGILNSAKK